MIFKLTSDAVKELEINFRKSVREHVKNEYISRVSKVIDLSSDDFKGCDYFVSGVKEAYRIVDAADYEDLVVGNRDALDLSVKRFASRVAGSYNVLTGIAYQVYGRSAFISDLYSTLRFSLVMNDGPSISDPSGLVPGWMAFRYKFVCGLWV